MNFEEAVEILDAAIFAKTEKHLKDVERFVLWGAWQSQTYDEMAAVSNYRYTPSYIKQGVGPRLWKLISETLDEEVSKTNFQAALERRTQAETSQNQELDYTRVITNNHTDNWEKSDLDSQIVYQPAHASVYHLAYRIEDFLDGNNLGFARLEARTQIESDDKIVVPTSCNSFKLGLESLQQELYESQGSERKIEGKQQPESIQVPINTCEQIEPVDQSTVSLLTPVMTEAEARHYIAAIKEYVVSLRKLLVEIEDRRGWEVLNYSSMTACMVAEFTNSKSVLIRELKVGRIEKHYLQVPVGTYLESQLRPLSKLSPEQYKLAVAKAHELAGFGKLTVTHVTKAVNEMLSLDQFVKQTPPAKYKPGNLVGITCQPGASPEEKAWDGYCGIVQSNWLRRGVSEIFPVQADSNNPDENLVQLLATTNRPLRVKLGIDPTGSDIHLGHSILVRKLRAFQDAGHTAVLIIGDFTARIGDPTGKSEVRRQLTEAMVAENAKSYLDQVRPILDVDTPGRLEVRYNSEWLSKLDLAKTLELLATMTVGQMLAKEGFTERYEKENPIYLHEFLYPLMQGYDSVAMAADVELGGTDQKFNIAVGRDLQRHFGLKPQFGLLLPILIGTDGKQKMSKSLGNYVGISEDSLSMYSKLEKTPDHLLMQYFESLTNLPLDQLPENPRERQKLLALEIVSQNHGRKAALQAQQAAMALVQGNKTDTSSVPKFSLSQVDFPAKLSCILSASSLCKSSSEARRQIQGGAVKLDGDRISQIDIAFNASTDLDGKVLQVGKIKFLRLVK